jgi:hypothetical protein
MSKNTARIWKGSLCYLDADGAVQSYTASASANTPILGVAAGSYDRVNGHPKPKTHATLQAAEVSSDSCVDVWDDPDIVFVAQADTSSGESQIGRFVTVSAGTPVTAAGRSGDVIKNSAIFASAGDGAVLKVVGLALNELDRTGEANNDLEVIIARHHFNTSNNNQ